MVEPGRLKNEPNRGSFPTVSFESLLVRPQTSDPLLLCVVPGVLDQL